jgi:hypothetical protein
LAAALLASAVSGCAGEQEALIVLGSPAFEEGECTANAGTSEFLQRGLIDVGADTRYTLPVVLLNSLRSRTTTNTGVDNGELQLRDVDVTLSMPQAPEVIAQVEDENPAFVEFSSPLPTISLPPGTETGVLVDVVTRMASASLRQAILDNLDATAEPILVANIVFHATRTGNSAGNVGVIDARAYSFPIDVCIDCLVTCLTCPNAQCPVDYTVQDGLCGNRQDTSLVPYGCEPLEE